MGIGNGPAGMIGDCGTGPGNKGGGNGELGQMRLGDCGVPGAEICNERVESELYRIYIVVKIRRVASDYVGETEEVVVAPSEQKTDRSSSG